MSVIQRLKPKVEYLNELNVFGYSKVGFLNERNPAFEAKS